jgi:hypothetical protein
MSTYQISVSAFKDTDGCSQTIRPKDIFVSVDEAIKFLQELQKEENK